MGLRGTVRAYTISSYSEGRGGGLDQRLSLLFNFFGENKYTLTILAYILVD